MRHNKHIFSTLCSFFESKQTTSHIVILVIVLLIGLFCLGVLFQRHQQRAEFILECETLGKTGTLYLGELEKDKTFFVCVNSV